MKTNQISFAAIILFLLGNTTHLQAQKINCWKGGTPGQATNWNCPKNWSAVQVPDAFHTVIIPDVSSGSGCYPIIKDGGSEVNALILESGATLTITKAGGLNVLYILEEYGDCQMEMKGKLYAPARRYAGALQLKSESDALAFAAK